MIVAWLCGQTQKSASVNNTKYGHGNVAANFNQRYWSIRLARFHEASSPISRCHISTRSYQHTRRHVVQPCSHGQIRCPLSSPALARGLILEVQAVLMQCTVVIHQSRLSVTRVGVVGAWRATSRSRHHRYPSVVASMGLGELTMNVASMNVASMRRHLRQEAEL